MSEVKNAAVPAETITLRDMGSFMFAGDVIAGEDGDTCHGDHGYAQYFVPAASRSLPVVMWHGLSQSGKSWESTPDGRDGFWQLFTRRDWSTYIIDQPRRGRAGRAIIHPDDVAPQIPNLDSEAVTWETYRLGPWQPPAKADIFPGVSFPTDAVSLDQFLKQQTPNTGAEPFPDAAHRDFMADAMGDLLHRTGPSVLMTHSHSGQYGWRSVMKHPALVRGVVSFECGEFAFPSDAPPEDIPTKNELLAEFMAGQLVPPEEFEALTQVPILLVYGDNFADEEGETFGVELWRIVRRRARQFVEAVNARGGDARMVELPEIGLKGNTHFPMTDLNNVEVVEFVGEWLESSGLAHRDEPHLGPGKPSEVISPHFAFDAAVASEDLAVTSA